MTFKTFHHLVQLYLNLDRNVPYFFELDLFITKHNECGSNFDTLYILDNE